MKHVLVSVKFCSSGMEQLHLSMNVAVHVVGSVDIAEPSLRLVSAGVL